MRLLKVLAVIALALWLAYGSSVLAASPAPSRTLFGDPGSPGETLTVQQVLGIITGLACWVSEVALVLILGALAFYGLMFMWSQGNPAKMGEAKKALGWGIVGIFVIFGTYTIILTVARAVGPAAEGRINPIPINCSSFF